MTMADASSEEEEEEEVDEESVMESEKKKSAVEGIVVFLRIRPTKRPSKFYDIAEGKLLEWQVPLEKEETDINNTRTNFKFRFHSILPTDIAQAQVFERVGESAVASALQGFNSTIFAYGQTGSGKTFTMTGGAERYEDRGLIPRSLSYIYQKFKENDGASYSARISYMEIYNEQGYDLLDAQDSQKTLPRVKMMEDERGNFHLKNLSSHVANTEEEALNLLFLGDTNRAISETAMNQASSRSHCIFTVFIEARKGDRVVRSKLNMVDLAGSERVHKTKSDGQTLREAQYINTSLFYLEMVIVALSEKARTHIPYRNSMMTTVLRDSLGGNCKTVMIATVSAEKEQTDESISTCRFAQRVALVKNEAVVNEEVDPFVAIARLKRQVETLKAEIDFLKNTNGDDNETLTDVEVADLASNCELYLAADDDAEDLKIVPFTLTRVRRCFAILKSYYQQKKGLDDDSSALKQALKEKDNEIAILVNMVRKGGALPVAKKQSSKEIEVKLQPPRQQAIAGVSCHVADADIRDDPQKAYAYFRERASANKALEENKLLLKDKYAKAKEVGERVNESRRSISYLKTSIEQIRRERAIEGLHESQTDDAVPSSEETQKKNAIDLEKTRYKESFDDLRKLKTEIETIQKMLDVGRARLQADFDTWYDHVLKAKPQEASARYNRAEPKQPPVPLTGNQDADDDIRAFYRAKDELHSLQASKRSF